MTVCTLKTCTVLIALLISMANLAAAEESTDAKATESSEVKSEPPKAETKPESKSESKSSNRRRENRNSEKQNSGASSGNEISDILESIGYPELQVVPRATERLALEAKGEDYSSIFTHWPVELSGLMTMAVGFTSKSAQKDDLSVKQKRDANSIATATTTVGGAWVVGGVILGLQHPYRRGAQTISKYQGRDERSMLLRERLAEEALERPARVMRVLENVAVISNFSMNALSMIHADDNGKVVAGLGVIMSFLPYMFQDHQIDVYDKHIEYKKKIYAPIKSASLHYDSSSKTFTPMTTLAWVF